MTRSLRIQFAVTAAIATTVLLAATGCTRHPAVDHENDDVQPVASSAPVLPALQPIPPGHMCRGADLYRKSPTRPLDWDKVDDGSASKYCRLEEVCKLTPCPDRMGPP